MVRRKGCLTHLLVGCILPCKIRQISEGNAIGSTIGRLQPQVSMLMRQDSVKRHNNGIEMMMFPIISEPNVTLQGRILSSMSANVTMCHERKRRDCKLLCYDVKNFPVRCHSFTAASSGCDVDGRGEEYWSFQTFDRCFAQKGRT